MADCDDGFRGRHWGDYIGLVLVGVGVVLQFIAWVVIIILFIKGFEPDKLTHISLGVTGLGNSLVLTGVGILKLKHNPPTNGNGAAKLENGGK